MKAQPQTPMAWSVLTTGPYVEMLNETQRPEQDKDGVYVFSAPLEEGAVPYIHLDDLGQYARWIFDTPFESIGLDLKVATEHIGYAQLADDFTAVTGMPARYENVVLDDSFMSKGMFHGDLILGAEYEGSNDDTLMSNSLLSISFKPPQAPKYKDMFTVLFLLKEECFKVMSWCLRRHT